MQKNRQELSDHSPYTSKFSFLVHLLESFKVAYSFKQFGSVLENILLDQKGHVWVRIGYFEVHPTGTI